MLQALTWRDHCNMSLAGIDMCWCLYVCVCEWLTAPLCCSAQFSGDFACEKTVRELKGRWIPKANMDCRVSNREMALTAIIALPFLIRIFLLAPLRKYCETSYVCCLSTLFSVPLTFSSHLLTFRNILTDVYFTFWPIQALMDGRVMGHVRKK